MSEGFCKKDRAWLNEEQRLLDLLVDSPGDVRDTAIAFIRSRLGCTSIEWTDDVVTDSAAVEVSDEVLGHLSAGVGASNSCSQDDLRLAADWLGRWLRVGRTLEEQRALALTDDLTGIGNRRAFDQRLDLALADARTRGVTVTLVLFDIDDFKLYNDRFGHPAGDEILIGTAVLLRSAIRPTDRVYRIGGDEFAVILHDPAGKRADGSQPPTDLEALAQRFQEQVRGAHFEALGQRAPGHLTLSGGLATFPDEAHAMDALVRLADERLLQSKGAGKNAITYGKE